MKNAVWNSPTAIWLRALALLVVSASGTEMLRAQSPADLPGASAAERAPELIDQIRLPLTDIKPERGLCYIARIPLLTPNERDDRQTGLRLFEDGVELTAGKSPHTDIRELGGGRFSHWGAVLYFSSSDGSNPLTNGRSYAVVFSQAQIVSDSRWAFTPVAEIAAEDIERGDGFASVYDLPVPIAGWTSDLETLNGSRLVLLEDGMPLGLAHARLDEIGSLGMGRYLHLGPRVWFSTTDNSDPRENGRRYVMALGDLPDHHFVDPLAGQHRPESVVLAPPRLEWPREGAVIDDARPTFRVADADDSLLYFWELDVEPTFDSANLHREPRTRQGYWGASPVRLLDRNARFASEFTPPYRLGVLAPIGIARQSPMYARLMTARLGFELDTGEEELREIFEFVAAQFYPLAESANIQTAEFTWLCDRGYCASINSLTAAVLQSLGYRSRRAQVHVPDPSALDPKDEERWLASHSSLEVYCNGRWSIFDPWLNIYLPGVSYQDLAEAPERKYFALAYYDGPDASAGRTDVYLSDYARGRRYDEFDNWYADISTPERERRAFAGEPASVPDPDWRHLWARSTLDVWVRVRTVRLPPESIGFRLLPRAEASGDLPEVIEVSPWTTVSFTIDLAEAYGFPRPE